jgi:ATP-dependent helicase/DNAse subunit B
MRKLYSEYLGRTISKEQINEILLNNVLLQNAINEVISTEFKSSSDSLANGNELIVRDVLLAYLNKILATDKSIAPFTLMNLEDSFSFKIETNSGGKKIEVTTGGKIDRIDIVSGITRIVDYKTGTVAEKVNSIGDLFEDDRKKDFDGWLQTLLYCESYMATNKTVSLYPSIYKIKKLTGGILSDKLRLKTETKTELIVDDYNAVRNEFLSGLQKVIADIFSIDEPFIMTSDKRGKCSYCPYRILCMR